MSSKTLVHLAVKVTKNIRDRKGGTQRFSAEMTSALEEAVIGFGMTEDLGEIIWERMGDGATEKDILKWARGYQELWNRRGLGRCKAYDSYNFVEVARKELASYAANKKRRRFVWYKFMKDGCPEVEAKREDWESMVERLYDGNKEVAEEELKMWNG